MVKRIVVFFVLMISFLSACSQRAEGQPSLSKTPDITLGEVETAITKQELELEKAGLPSENAFIQQLNGMLPKAYFIGGKTLSILSPGGEKCAWKAHR